VNKVVSEAHKKRNEKKSHSLLFVKNKDGHETTFVDLGVYSRNRAFRLYLSSKASKKLPLKVTDRVKNSWGSVPEEKIFFHSLVGNVTSNARLISLDNDSSQFKIEDKKSHSHTKPRGDVSNLGPSPYKELETFILEVCRRNRQGAKDQPVRIRSWAMLGNESLILYNVSGYRFCGNIGREHKSNGVFFVVDLEHGTWCQKCYDPDCRQYRSPGGPVPLEILSLKNTALTDA